MKILKTIGVVSLIVLAIFIKDKFFPNTVTNTKTVTKTDTIRDTTTVVKQLPAPEPDTVVEVKEVPMPEDSSDLFDKYYQLYQEHHRQNFYDDVLKDDSVAFIRVEETVHGNKIVDRKLFYKNRKPTVVNKTIKETIIHRNRLFFGGEIGNSTIQPSVMFQTKNNMIYKVGYDLSKPEGIRFGVYTSLSDINNWIN